MIVALPGLFSYLFRMRHFVMFSFPRRTVCCFLVLGVVVLIKSLNYSMTLSLLNIHAIFYFRSLMTSKTIGMVCGLMKKYRSTCPNMSQTPIFDVCFTFWLTDGKLLLLF